MATPIAPAASRAPALQVGVVVIAALYLGREVLIPITLAILLSFLLAPVVELLGRARLGRVPAVLLAVLMAVGLLSGFGGVIGSQLAQLAGDIPQYSVTIERKVDAARASTIGRLDRFVGSLGHHAEPQSISRTPAGAHPSPGNSPAGASSQSAAGAAAAPTASLLGLAESYLSTALLPLVTVGIVFVVTIFILLQRQDLRDRLIRLFGATDLHRTTSALDDAARRLSRYFLTQLAINATFGLVIGVGLYFIGVPNPVLWGMLSALLRFVPYIGSFIAAGLPIALAVGMDNFNALRDGAREMDQHFRHAPLERNIPVLAALLGVWYIDFFGATAHAVLPYDQRLEHLPAYLQQLEMESNGKRVRRDGSEVDYATAPVVFGTPGTNGQHAFYQLLHQGTQLIPADFIACCRSDHQLAGHHALLLANYFAQTEALARGKTAAEAEAEMRKRGMPETTIAKILPHRVFPGNRPTTSILLSHLEPRTLGALIAFYEHKTFVQSVIWGINAFDQWGVELGKQLADRVLPELEGNTSATAHDASTNGLINHFKANR